MNASELTNAIGDTLTLYAHDVTQEVKAVARAMANDAERKMRTTPKPKRTGVYRRSWRVDKAYDSASEVRYSVHNKKKYQLTHLLEDGHRARDGSMVKPIPHIKPVNDWVHREFEKRVKMLLKGW